MASNTPNLQLYKKDPVIDGADVFNIETMLNENWDKIDAAMANVPDRDEVANKIQGQATALNKLRKYNSEQDKEIAYLKLKQEATERIEGGTTFADDMQGNSFGITFDAESSENIVVKDGGLTMNQGSMVEHTVEDATVIEGNYTTQGNGGRKLVRLDDGTLVCAFKTSGNFYIYKSTNNGSTWALMYSAGFSSVQDICLETDGTYIYCLVLINSNIADFYVLNKNNVLINSSRLVNDASELGTCSLTINPEGTELHACWASKNSKFPNSYNIQYCKGVIGEGGTVTWGSVEQVTTHNSTAYDNKSPSITVNSLGNPTIIHSHTFSTSNLIHCRVLIDSTWKWFAIINGGTYAQSYPSAIFVPKSVNGLENGRIWVAWQGMDSTDSNYYNIRVSYSDDDCVTWSTPEKLTSGNTYTQLRPSITANKSNEIFVTWMGFTADSTNKYVIRQTKWKDDSWGVVENLKYDLVSSGLFYPSALFDHTWSLSFSKPLFINMVNGVSINFAGSWTTGGYTPTTEGTAVYTLPSTDYVGLFVKKEGDVNITATVNDTPMDSELSGDEYQFTKALDTEAPVTLKLQLSRENTTNGDNDKVTRILGGRS